MAYEIQLDTTGANFTNPKKKSISISKDLSYTFTQSELNDYLLNTLELKPAMEHNIEFRVKAFLVKMRPYYIQTWLNLRLHLMLFPLKLLHHHPANCI